MGPRDRLGRIATVTDALGVWTMNCNADTPQLASEQIPGIINRTILHSYADSLDQSRAREEAVGLQLHRPHISGENSSPEYNLGVVLFVEMARQFER